MKQLRKIKTGSSASCLFVMVTFLALLGACADIPESQARYSYTLTVALEPDDTLRQIEARHYGEVILWRPEAAFAVLGFYERELIGPQADEADENQSAVQAPEAEASGLTGWARGANAWGGGWSAGTGEALTTFEENLPLWDQIKLPEAQALSPNLGAGVTVAVIDTGIDLAHPAFAGRLAPREAWRDFVDDDDEPQEVPGDAYGHGSGVAGVIVQVAPNVTLLPIRALRPDGSGDLSDVALAVDWAIGQGARIINLSLGSNSDYKTLKELMKYAKKREVALVASVGNHGGDEIEFPARYENEVLSVGSVDREDIKSDFSAYGKKLELFAPGEEIYTSAPESRVIAWSGTSFAAPIATGALALALGEAALSGDVKMKDLEKRLLETAEDISKREGNRRFKELGEGRLDLAAFLKKLDD